MSTQTDETVPVLNPAETERWIREVKDQIARGVRIVTDAETEARRLRRDFDEAWAYAMQRAEGPEYQRKAQAVIDTMPHRAKAEIALRYAERRAKALDRELFAAMGINANIRTMWTGAGVGE